MIARDAADAPGSHGRRVDGLRGRRADGRSLAGEVVLACLAGVALALAHPSPGWAALGWVAPAPLLALAVSRDPRRAGWLGWIGGALGQVLLLRWLEYTIRTYSVVPWPLSWLGVAGLGAYCGLYAALVMAAVAWLAGRLGQGWGLFAAPWLWVLGEWLRGAVPAPFPWAPLGQSQVGYLPALQVAELGGVLLVSWTLAAVAAGLAGAVMLAGKGRVLATLAAALVAAASIGYGHARLTGLEAVPATDAPLVAALQPAVPQELKEAPEARARWRDLLLRMTQDALGRGAALVVWPETAAPVPLEGDPALASALARLLDKGPARVLVGSIGTPAAPGGRYRNAAFLVGGQGITERYDKIRLVPFGEYVPLPALRGPVLTWAQFTSELDAGQRVGVFPGPPAPFGVVICYEGVFPGAVRALAVAGGRFMVNMTNDAWFGRTSGPLQHLAAYSVRAVEQRMGIVRSANTGVSAVIAPSGALVARLDLYTRGIVTARVPLGSGLTLYARAGEWVALVAAAVIAVLGAAGLRASASAASQARRAS